MNRLLALSWLAFAGNGWSGNRRPVTFFRPETRTADWTVRSMTYF